MKTEKYRVAWGSPTCIARVTSGIFKSEKAAERLRDAAERAGRFLPVVTVAEESKPLPRRRKSDGVISLRGAAS